MSSPRAPDTTSPPSGWLPQVKDTVQRAIRARFARDVAALQVSNSAQKVLAAVFWVVLYRLLSPEEIGQYVHVLAFFGTINLLGYLSLGPSLVTRLAEAAAAHDPGELRRIMGYLIKINAAWALPVTALTWLVATPLSVWWYGEPLYGEPVKILALGAPLAVLTLAMTTALQSVSRMHSIALVEVCAKTTHTLLGVGAMVAGLGLTGLVSATVISQAVGCAIGLLAYQRILHRSHAFASLPAVGGDGDHCAVAGLLPLQRPGSCGQEYRCALRTDTRAPPRPLHAAGASRLLRRRSQGSLVPRRLSRCRRAQAARHAGRAEGASRPGRRAVGLLARDAPVDAAGAGASRGPGPLLALLSPGPYARGFPFAHPGHHLCPAYRADGPGRGLWLRLPPDGPYRSQYRDQDADQSGLLAPRCAAGDAVGGQRGAALYMLVAYSVGYVAYLSLLASNRFWQASARPPAAANQPVSV